MKHTESNKKSIVLLLLSLALFFGCNVNDSVTEEVNVKVMLRGKVYNGETGEEVPNAVITIYEPVRTRDGDDDFRDYERATATTIMAITIWKVLSGVGIWMRRADVFWP